MMDREELHALALSALPSQYRDASVFRAVLLAIVDVIWDQIGAPLNALDGWPDPDQLEGPALDLLGHCLGLERPYEGSGEYFGFKGTEADGGKTFGQGPFYTPLSGLDNVVFAGDPTYRILLKWRARALGGAPTYGELQGILGSVTGFDGVTVTTDAGGVRIASGVVEGTDANVWAVLGSSRDLTSRLIFPRVAGVDYQFDG